LSFVLDWGLSFLVHVQNTDSYAGWQGPSTVRWLAQFPTSGAIPLRHLPPSLSSSDRPPAW